MSTRETRDWNEWSLIFEAYNAAGSTQLAQILKRLQDGGAAPFLAPLNETDNASVPKLQRKSEPGLAVDDNSTIDQTPDVWHNNLFAPTSTMDQRRTNACVIEKFGPLVKTAASGHKRRQPLRTSLGYDSFSRHHHV